MGFTHALNCCQLVVNKHAAETDELDGWEMLCDRRLVESVHAGMYAPYVDNVAFIVDHEGRLRAAVIGLAGSLRRSGLEVTVNLDNLDDIELLGWRIRTYNFRGVMKRTEARPKNSRVWRVLFLGRPTCLTRLRRVLDDNWQPQWGTTRQWA